MLATNAQLLVVVVFSLLLGFADGWYSKEQYATSAFKNQIKAPPSLSTLIAHQVQVVHVSVLRRLLSCRQIEGKPILPGRQEALIQAPSCGPAEQRLDERCTRPERGRQQHVLFNARCSMYNTSEVFDKKQSAVCTLG